MRFLSICEAEASLHGTTHVGSALRVLYDTISLLLKFKHSWSHVQDE